MRKDLGLTPAKVAGRFVGASPSCWGWADGLDGDRADIVLAEARRLGLSGVECGPDGFLPQDADAATQVLQRHRIPVVAGVVQAVLHDAAQRREQLKRVESKASWLADIGAQVVILDCILADGDGPLSSLGWAALLDAIGTAQDMCAGLGLALAVHPSEASVIASRPDLERFLIGCEAGLCLDTAHFYIDSGGSLELLEIVAPRVKHVQLRDVDLYLSSRVQRRRLKAELARARGLYPDLGTGDLDIAGTVSTLDRSGYRGWYVFEMEPGPQRLEKALDFLRNLR